MIPPGNYTLQASAPDLALPQPVKIMLKAGIQLLNLQLNVATTAQQVRPGLLRTPGQGSYRRAARLGPIHAT